MDVFVQALLYYNRLQAPLMYVQGTGCLSTRERSSSESTPPTLKRSSKKRRRIIQFLEGSDDEDSAAPAAARTSKELFPHTGSVAYPQQAANGAKPASTTALSGQATAPSSCSAPVQATALSKGPLPHQPTAPTGAAAAAREYAAPSNGNLSSEEAAGKQQPARIGKHGPLLPPRASPSVSPQIHRKRCQASALAQDTSLLARLHKQQAARLLEAEGGNTPSAKSAPSEGAQRGLAPIMVLRDSDDMQGAASDGGGRSHGITRAQTKDGETADVDVTGGSPFSLANIKLENDGREGSTTEVAQSAPKTEGHQSGDARAVAQPKEEQQEFKAGREQNEQAKSACAGEAPRCSVLRYFMQFSAAH